MPTYRAFFFDAQRHIVDCREFNAGHHGEALDTARQWADGMPMEVWQGGEMIGTLPPVSRPSLSETMQGARLPFPLEGEGK